MEKEHHGFLYGLLAAIASAGMAVFVKLAAAVPVETMVFTRFALGLPLLGWIIIHQKIEISWKKVPRHLTRGIAGLASIYFYFYAVKLTPLVNAVTLANTAPLFMPLITLLWLKLIVSNQRFWAIGIGFLGVVILLRPTTDLLEWGNVFALASGLLSAIAYMGIRQLSKTESTGTILAYFFLISTILSFFPMIVTWESTPKPNQWILLTLIGLFTLLAQYANTKAFSHAPATKVSTLSYGSVALSGLTGWWIFGEVPDIWVWVGIILIIGGAFIALFDKTKARPLR